jgi:hypothetical protein
MRWDKKNIILNDKLINNKKVNLNKKKSEEGNIESPSSISLC